MSDSTLDLRPLPPERQAAVLLQAFDALPPGGSLRLTAGGDLRPLLKALIAGRWGAFAWAPLRADDGDWRATLTRRAANGAPAISELMEADHRRCDALYAAAEEAAREGELPAMRERFSEFALGMRRHFEMEEQCLFPEFDGRMGHRGQGPTAVMREEHAQMRGLLDQMALAAEEGDPEALAGAGETLLILMEQHNFKEEEMLYAMMDQVCGRDATPILQRALLF
jgi:uncharacterized protein (DUF2249 family)